MKPITPINLEEPIINEIEIPEFAEDNSEKEEIPVKVINTGEYDLYYYKVYEEHNGNADEDKQYQETYYFKTDNLLKRKFDAEDWYNRRKIAISNKKKWHESQQSSIVKFGVKLYLVEGANSYDVNEFLLKDEHGMDNNDN